MFAFSLVAMVLLTEDAALKSPLPVSWHGDWAGTLVMLGPANKPTEVALKFTVAPLPGTRDLTWKLTYGDGAKSVVKDYILKPDGDKPGRFLLDEQNGVILEMRLANDKLYSLFQVGETLLTARYELRGEAIHFEVTSAKPTPAKTGQGQVQGFTTEAVQSAELKRTKS
jgi:hypothetical protein